MRLGPKLLAPQLVVLAMIVAAALVQAFIIRSEQRTLDRATSQLERGAARIQRLHQLFSDSERDALSQYLAPDPRQARRLLDAQEESAHLLEEISQLPWPKRGAELAEDLRLAYRGLGEAQLDFLAQQDPAQARRAFVRWWFLAQRASAMLTDLSTYNMRRMDRALGEVRADRRRMGMAILFLTLAASILAAGFAFFVVRRVLLPIGALTLASKRFGEPGISVPRWEGRLDELGTLSSTLADMTDRLTRAREQLEEALAARDQFLSIAAHELKTPLTSLHLQLQLVQRRIGKAQDAGLARSAESLDRQVRRMAQLVDDLLDVTRLQAGRLELHREVVQLAPEIQEVCTRCEQLLTEAECTLSLELDSEARAEIDRSRFDQVLVNLLGNAAKHAPGSKVTVRLARVNGQVELAVKDDGPGIADEVRPRLFQRFGRLEHGPGAGLGLGLHISSQIVQSFRGTIDVNSAQGRGTEFIVRLPSA